MDEVDNKYIDNAITSLFSTVGIKECIDEKNIIPLINSRRVKEAIKEIAKYLGLPIEVNLSFVSKGYSSNNNTNNNNFSSKHLVKTDQKGRGIGGITAQVSIPSNLPLYGTPGMVNFPINIRISENCLDDPEAFISVMSHELSHIVLYSIWHKEKDNEFYTDLTAMMLGFADIMIAGRKIIETNTHTDYGFLSSKTTTTTQTTTYGYLSDKNFDFALEKIKKILKTSRHTKNQLAKKIKKLEKKIREQKIEIFYFKKYLNYLDKNLKQKISKQDGHWITIFHHADYINGFESAIDKAENELRQFISFTKNLNHYSDYCFEKIKKIEVKIQSIDSDIVPKYNQVRGAVIILKRYVSITYRFQSFLKTKFGAIRHS